LLAAGAERVGGWGEAPEQVAGYPERVVHFALLGWLPSHSTQIVPNFAPLVLGIIGNWTPCPVAEQVPQIG
jgi:hypothetical protein